MASAKAAERPEGTRIAPALAGLAVPIDVAQPHPDNPRDGDVGAITESLRRFGQQRPIVVQRSTGFIIAGNHLWRAAKALGWEQIAAAHADMDDRTARAYMLADNRTQDLGSYNDAALAALLRDLAADGDLAGTGYDGDDLDALIADLDRQSRPATPPQAGFLDTFLQPGAEDYSAAPAAAAPAAALDPDTPAPRPTDGYVQLAFVALPDQRDRITEAIRRAKALGGFETSIDALVLIADEFCRSHQ